MSIQRVGSEISAKISPVSLQRKMDNFTRMIERSAGRVARLGQWPAYIEPGSLLERVPKLGDKNASGFDAGIACALNLIPRNKQELPATLHANYTGEAIEQVRREIEFPNPDSGTTWWLAACSLCKEGKGGVDQELFLSQIKEFKELAKNPQKRLAAAQAELENMLSNFRKVNGVPYGEKDGCIQGAYIAGHLFGICHDKSRGVYQIGTYDEGGLGLEGFPWHDKNLGPVFGSHHFVECANEEELWRAVAIVKEKIK